MSTIRILAIEDDLIHQENLRMVVEDLGYLLIEVVSGVDEFKRLIKASVPDILIIDIDLGNGIDGIQLAIEIADFCHAPFIFLTSFRDSDTILRARQSLPSAFLAKPIDTANLQAAIEIAVAGTKSQSRETAKEFRPSISANNLFIKENGILKKVSVGEIQFIEVDGKNCKIHMGTEIKNVTARLKDLIEKLPNDLFIQVHRSFVIGIDHLIEVDSGLTQLKIGNSKIPIGKNFKETLSVYLNRIG